MGYLDLALVDYGNGNKEICEAPPFCVSVGERVVTDFGIGTVEECATVVRTDGLYELLRKERKLPRVKSYLRDFSYEEDSDGT